MRDDELIAGLRACLEKPAPEAGARRALAAELRSRAEASAAGAPRWREISAAIEGASDTGALAVAGATAMRLLMQDRAQAAAGGAGDEPEAEENARARNRKGYLERSQARALAADDATAPVLQRPVESLPGIGRAVGLSLRSRGIATLADLVDCLPLGYHDERQITPIAELRVGERQVTEGRVVSASAVPRGRARRMAEVLLESQPAEGAAHGAGAAARLRLIWFRAPNGLLSRFQPGARFRVAGTVERFSGMASMSHPQTERLSAGQPALGAGIVPRYPLVPGVAPRLLGRAIAAAVERCAPHVPDAVPEALRRAHGLGPVGEALRALHQPSPALDGERFARLVEHRTEHHERLAFEEFFLLELGLHQRRLEEQGLRGEALHARPEPLLRARRALPFELTVAQQRALAEIAGDLERDQPMRRLLQGDVGSGKTAVALLAAAHAVAAGAQAAIMAPTEILAEQHFRALAPLCEAMGLRAALVLGGERAAHRRKVRKALEEGRLDLAVGTHALLTEGVRFQRLRLCVVDEQHRFGVGQRLRLADKAAGLAPHLLVMTATPIPRSLALALHGDLAASVIDELPPGRLPPVTRAYPSSARAEALRQLERGLESGGQAFVVCPAIEPNEETGVRSALETFGELAQRFAAYGVGLLHGRLSPEDKQQAMDAFLAGTTRVLVTTTVVEVGVDVPRANVILIEHAERFGLAQLHQLRGRVGRGGQRSACLLVHEASGEDARDRLRIVCESNDGFRLAEEDLRLRGPGELFGRKQSGLPGFRFGDLRRDLPLLQRARELAQALIASDPELSLPEHAGARQALAALAQSERALVKEEAG